MAKKQTAVSVVGVPRELSDGDVAVIVEMARERAALVAAMKAALEVHDDERALQLARQITGMEVANQ